MTINLLDIDSLVEKFIETHEQGIVTMHQRYFDSNNQVSIRALTTELFDELKVGCISFVNKNYPLEELDTYLFYVANAFCKKKAAPFIKKKSQYLCPGCLFLGIESVLIEEYTGVFGCAECSEKLKSTTDPKKKAFFSCFARHRKNGYHCSECDRFIPHAIDASLDVICPYFDCCFVGKWDNLKRMHHPNFQTNIELSVLDASNEQGSSLKDRILDTTDDPLSQLELKQDLQEKVRILRDVIEGQRNSVAYSSADFTAKHKYFVYQAISNLLEAHQHEMVDYLLYSSRSGGFQHKIFQEYISLLEKSLPFVFKKQKTVIKIDSLLDPNLNLFDGISVFDALVTEKLEIKNNTQEFYIGGRKATYSQPFYMGKLLSVIHQKTKMPLTDKVAEYSFSKIKMKNVDVGTPVIVSHLRIPPHYQMGGMVHVNRVRKKIVERAISLIGKS